MEGADILLRVSGLSIAFAGFVSIAVRFQYPDHREWSAHVVVRFRNMLEVSLSALFFAILPFALFHLGLSGSRLWAAASAVLIVGLSLVTLRVYRRARPYIGVDLGRGFTRLTLSLTALVLIAQVLNVLGRMPVRRFGVYLVGVFWVLFFAAIQFLRLVVLPSPVGDDA
jgi:hypothetical protein